ncbi:MAG: hypothetical protein IPO15_08170 [Anaerolineae bacterium]|uniref:hypothetical protein n=1 Tax=Candidatus Amarolinea dominans TaxID=3140696 RepID=UPI003136F8C1|nr:hypothetical protein [Anaerolineae bacterium]
MKLIETGGLAWRDAIVMAFEKNAKPYPLPPAVPNVAHIQPQRAGRHKETADQTQIGNFSAFFVISVVKNQATFETAALPLVR